MVSNKFVEDAGEGVAIYVQPPAKRIIHIGSQGHDEDSDYDSDYLEEYHTYDEKFFLSFPHVIFRVHYRKSGTGYMASDLRVAFANKMKPTKLYVPPLFNIDNTLRVCVTLPNKFFRTVDECVEQAVLAFWRTKFEDSMYDAYGANYDRKDLVGDPRKWQRKTKKNPKWVPNGRSLEEFSVRFGKFSSVTHLRKGEDDEDAYEEDY